MASRAPACVKSHVRGVLLSGSINLGGLRASNQRYRWRGSASTAAFCSSSVTAHRPPVALLFPPRQQHQQQPQQHRHRGFLSSSRNKPAHGFRCCSTSTVVAAAAPPPGTRSAACSLPLSSARTHRHHHHHHHHRRQQQQPFCTSSSSSGSSSSGASGKLDDVHVTHVDSATAAEGGGDDDGREMMPEEDRQPVGAGSTAQGSEDEPNTVRFLDVPGSEQTREEKMTIVFTCTVCETRTAKTFAKLSYEKGVVLARCPGCHNLHLIADRLGWFEEAGDGAEGWDIEKITNRIGESDCHVVNEDNVMELNLVDVVGKTTKQKEASPERGDGSDSSPVSPKGTS